MKTRTAWVLAPVAALALSACATKPGADAEEVTEQMGRDAIALQSYRVNDWSAPNNQTLMIRTVDGQQYRAQMLSPCWGLQFANTVGFTTRGGNTLDRFSGVVLPDGTRCQFRNLERVPAATAGAE
jgi:hypothetical protein